MILEIAGCGMSTRNSNYDDAMSVLPIERLICTRNYTLQDRANDLRKEAERHLRQAERCRLAARDNNPNLALVFERRASDEEAAARKILEMQVVRDNPSRGPRGWKRVSPELKVWARSMTDEISDVALARTKHHDQQPASNPPVVDRVQTSKSGQLTKRETRKAAARESIKAAALAAAWNPIPHYLAKREEGK
jgi:hypothetical protein